MYPAHRLAPCVALLLAACAPLAHAIDANQPNGPYAAGFESAVVPAPLSARVAGSAKGVWNRRGLAAGLSTKLEGGWTVAVNLTRAIGGAGGTSNYDRYSTGNVRADGRPWPTSPGRRAIVLSLTHRY